MAFSEDTSKITDSHECPECMVCHQSAIIGITDEEAKGIQAWYAGELIQVALPNTSPEKRELIKTGFHPECWDKMFGGEE